MKNFYYKGIDLYGKKINGYMLATDKINAEKQLIKNGVIIEKIIQYRNFNKIFKPNNNFELFIKNLSELLSSGLPLTDSLEFIAAGKAGKLIQNEGINIFEDIKKW